MKRRDDGYERIYGAMESAERGVALAEGLMEQARQRGDGGTARLLQLVAGEARGAAQDLAACLGLRCDV